MAQNFSEGIAHQARRRKHAEQSPDLICPIVLPDPDDPKLF
jgi:hypothetical protein